MRKNLLLKKFFCLVAFGLILCYVTSSFVFAQVVSNAYSVKSELRVSANVDSAKLTSAILQNTLYTKTAAEVAYCDFVIRRCEDGTIPKRILYYVYYNTINAERNQRFVRFQKKLEYICKREKINLSYSYLKFSDFKASKSAVLKLGRRR
ncbi:MAG: hypothetical protein LBP59_02410 [Planctomycetaceae bacterium]|nr:hypothetical protein [Planctomycetaceae bacterium]